MKICFVIGDLIGGGSERAVCLLSSEMARRGEDITILCVPNSNESYPLDENVKIIKTPKYNSKFKDFFVRSRDFRKVFKKHNFDVIISFTTQKNVCVLFSTLFTKNKVIISERNDPYHDPKSRLLRILRKLLYWKCDGAVFQTEDAKMFFSKRIQKKSIVIPNAIDLSKIRPFSGERKKRVVVVGRLEPEKNTIMAVEAFSNIFQDNLEYSLEIYGEGSCKESLQQYIIANNLKNVHLMGFRNDIFNLISDSSVFLFPSNYEGISNALLEALALGIPCISTDHPIGGARLLIENGKNGFLVPVSDVKAMSNRLCELIHNRDLMDIFSNNSISFIKSRFSLSHITKEWILYCSKIIG